MPFQVGDRVVDIRNINNYDVTARQLRYGVITSINNTFASVTINDVVQEIPIEYLIYTSRLT
jgi:hypothetical protein